MRDWLVAADDRTGAFEVAAIFAEVVGPVLVTVGEPPRGSGVVDIGTRTLPADIAVSVAASIDEIQSTWIGHKIDSTLRGNWAEELRARQLANGRRVVVLPAWPAMGRTCVRGVVMVDGWAIGDVRDRLYEAELLADASQLRTWLGGGGRVAACDVPDSDAMHAVAAELVGHDVMVAGPAGPLGAAFAAGRTARSVAQPIGITPSVLVVCGSANPVSRAQIDRLRDARPEVEIIATEIPDGDLQPAVAAALAARVHGRIAERRPATIVIIGGETAADVLGDEARVISGFVAPGMPYLYGADGALIITKAGGFGGPDALVDLIARENG